MMQAAHDDDEIFVYMGGHQQVPWGVRRARIHKSVKNIPLGAFHLREYLIYVEFHDGIEIIETEAFYQCTSLKGPIRLLGVKIIEPGAFNGCTSLTDAEFGDKLERIEEWAFNDCTKLTNVTMSSSVRVIDRYAFGSCRRLTDLDLPETLHSLQCGAFYRCEGLRRIAIPLNCSFGVGVFNSCPEIRLVYLVGGIHKTVASLHEASWRNDMKDEINRINNFHPPHKTEAIKFWINSVNDKIDWYKRKHQEVLEEATTLLALALWKANLDDVLERKGFRTTRRQLKRVRNETCVTSGASVVIKNVLPFLQLE